MHRHGYQGRKFHRERDQRRALIKGLAESFVRDESIETTVPKAKELVPYMEKLITLAKKGDLHNRRQIIGKLQTVGSAHKLVDEIAPQLRERNSGHIRLTRTSLRRGDNAPMARVSFVDDLGQAKQAATAVPNEAQAKSDGKSVSKGNNPKSSSKTVKTRATASKEEHKK